MTLEKILNLLRGGTMRTAAEYRAARAGIDLEACVATVEAYQARREALLLRGTDAEIERSEADVRNAQREADRARAAVAELERLTAAAEEREKVATIESKAAEAQRLQRQLIEAFIAFDELAAQLAAKRGDIEGGMKQLEAANGYLAEHGRDDMRVKTPRQLLAEQGVAEGDLPSLTYWSCPGYSPFPNAGQIYSTPKPRPFGLAAKLL